MLTKRNSIFFIDGFFLYSLHLWSVLGRVQKAYIFSNIMRTFKRNIKTRQCLSAQLCDFIHSLIQTSKSTKIEFLLFKMVKQANVNQMIRFCDVWYFGHSVNPKRIHTRIYEKKLFTGFFPFGYFSIWTYTLLVPCRNFCCLFLFTFDYGCELCFGWKKNTHTTAKRLPWLY